jgi:hypothetical protein
MTAVAFEMEEGMARLVKPTPQGRRPTRGQNLVAGLTERGDFKMSTDEVIALMRGPAAKETLPS